MIDLANLPIEEVQRTLLELRQLVLAADPAAPTENGPFCDIALYYSAICLTGAEQATKQVLRALQLPSLAANETEAVKLARHVPGQLLDALCRAYLVTPRAATRARGEVRLCLPRPGPIVLGVGDVFSSEAGDYLVQRTLSARQRPSRRPEDDCLLTKDDRGWFVLAPVVAQVAGPLGNAPAGLKLEPPAGLKRWVTEVLMEQPATGGGHSENVDSVVRRLCRQVLRLRELGEPD